MNLLNAISTYGRFLCMIFRELLAIFPRKIIGITILSWCSIFAMTTSFAGFFILMNAWIKQNGVSIASWTFHFHDNILLTVCAATSFLVLGTTGAWCLLYIELMIARIAIRFHQYLGLEFLKQTLNSDEDGWQGFFCYNLKSEFSRLINSDLRKRSMIGKHLLQGILPMITCCVAGFIMFYTEWVLSVLVIIISLLFLPNFFKINRSTVAMQREFETLGQMYRSRFSKSLKNQLYSETKNSSETLSDFICSDLFFQHKFMFLRRFIQGNTIQALNSTFFSIILYILVLFYLLPGSNESIFWEKLLVFGIAFRFFFGSFRSVAGMISTCSRLYPGAEKIDRLRDYCRQLKQREPFTPSQIFKRLTTLQLSNHQGSDLMHLKTGRLHLIHMASSMSVTDSFKQQITLFMNYAVPKACPFQGIEVWSSSMAFGLKQLKNDRTEGFDRHSQLSEIDEGFPPDSRPNDEPFLEFDLTFTNSRQQGKQRVLFLSSKTMFSSTYHLLKTIAEKENNALIFLVITTKDLRKFADMNDRIIVFKDCFPFITSVEKVLALDEKESAEELDEIFDEA